MTGDPRQPDLESALRRSGPREAGGHQIALPASVDEARGALRAMGPRRAPPAILQVGLTAAAAVVVVVGALAVAQLLAAPSPGPQVGGGSSGEPEATATPAPGACLAYFLVGSAEPFGGAAGSRGATVSVMNRGEATCYVQGSPGAVFSDANGQNLAYAPENVGATDAQILLASGQSAVTNVTWSNICGDPPTEPVSVSLSVGRSRVAVALSPQDTSVPVPPCSGGAESAAGTTPFTAP